MQQLEPLTTDELAFIIRRYRTESAVYMRTMNVLLVVGAIAPLVMCVVIMVAKVDQALPISYYYNIYFGGVLFMMLIVGLVAFISYQVKLYAYHKDRTHKRKIIEPTRIMQKKYMKLNNTYHFYLSSASRYTIEVHANDYDHWQLGDEITIEYAQYSKEYFGYF